MWKISQRKIHKNSTLILWLTWDIQMTSNKLETILIDGYHRRMDCDPLVSWLSRRKNRNFRFERKKIHSKKYIASWCIQDGQLYLKKISGKFLDGSKVTIPKIFSNYSNQYYASVGAYPLGCALHGQFAFWFNGKIECSLEKFILEENLDYVHIYEKNLILHFENGVLRGSCITENSKKFYLEDEWRDLEYIDPE